MNETGRDWARLGPLLGLGGGPEASGVPLDEAETQEHHVTQEPLVNITSITSETINPVKSGHLDVGSECDSKNSDLVESEPKTSRLGAEEVHIHPEEFNPENPGKKGDQPKSMKIRSFFFLFDGFLAVKWVMCV